MSIVPHKLNFNKNAAETLRHTLQSTLPFQEVLVLDTGSTDETLTIARSFPNVVIHEAPFSGFGPTHNLASELASHDWILSLDSDEVLSAPLVQELLSLSLDPGHVYALLRHNYFNGKRIKGCAGWHPDWVVRLYHRTATRFTNAAVHEKIITERLKEVKLSSPLLHTPYRKMEDFLAKMQTYSTLFAEQNRHHKGSTLWQAIYHSWFAFFKSYFLKRGFLGGKEGFIISLYNGHTTFYKYLKLMEARQNDSDL